MGDMSYPHGRIGLKVENGGSTDKCAGLPAPHSYCAVPNLYAARSDATALCSPRREPRPVVSASPETHPHLG
jgi:hypothetical protein